MSLTETATSFLVLLGVFLLAYSAIRHQGIGDTFREIKSIWDDKVHDGGLIKGVYQ